MLQREIAGAGNSGSRFGTKRARSRPAESLDDEIRRIQIDDAPNLGRGGGGIGSDDARVSGENAWRWMLGAEAIPALIYTLLCVRSPASPRWLISHAGNRLKGVEVLRIVRPDATEAEIPAEADSIQQASSGGVGSSRFWTRSLRIPILLAFLIAFFNQLSGINAVLYFAPRIFEMTGLHAPAYLSVPAQIKVADVCHPAPRTMRSRGLSAVTPNFRKTRRRVGDQSHSGRKRSPAPEGPVRNCRKTAGMGFGQTKKREPFGSLSR